MNVSGLLLGMFILLFEKAQAQDRSTATVSPRCWTSILQNLVYPGIEIVLAAGIQ
jgi:hypothetical protein